MIYSTTKMRCKHITSAFFLAQVCQYFWSGRGQWAVRSLHWSPKVYYDVFLLVLKILICYFVKLSVHAFHPLLVIYRRGNFVYHHQGCTSIYRPLSYPFRSLNFSSTATGSFPQSALSSTDTHNLFLKKIY